MGRTGEHFMEFAIPGFVKRFCTPNAILTLLEYAQDYAPENTRVSIEKRIKEELKDMDEGPIKDKLLERIDLVKAGKRDLYF
jgi:2-iminoacetate synthase